VFWVFEMGGCLKSRGGDLCRARSRHLKSGVATIRSGVANKLSAVPNDVPKPRTSVGLMQWAWNSASWPYRYRSNRGCRRAGLSGRCRLPTQRPLTNLRPAEVTVGAQMLQYQPRCTVQVQYLYFRTRIVGAGSRLAAVADFTIPRPPRPLNAITNRRRPDLDRAKYLIWSQDLKLKKHLTLSRVPIIVQNTNYISISISASLHSTHKP
jgi:hypothetical protein